MKHYDSLSVFKYKQRTILQNQMKMILVDVSRKK